MHNNIKDNQIFHTFINHCATIIQSNFKGYKQRKYYNKFLPIYKRLKQLLYAGFMAWKTRRVMKLSYVKSKIVEINTLKTAQQKSMKLRIAKRDFSDEIIRLLKNGMWTYYILKQKKTPLSQRNFSFNNQKYVKGAKKANLKQILKIIPKPVQKRQIQRHQGKKETNIVLKSLQQKISKQKQFQQQMYEKNKIIKMKKLEIPPKEKNKDLREQKQKLAIQIIQKQGKSQEQFNSNLDHCETPSYVMSVLDKFVLFTKPRNQLQSKTQEKLSDSDIQKNFKKINVLNYTSKKGLNMTLSKKNSEIKSCQIMEINQNILRDFNKTKIKNKQNADPSQKDRCQQNKSITAFDQRLKIQKNQLNEVANCKKVIDSKTDLSFHLRKQEFEKKKIEFKNRSQRFKNSCFQ